MPTNNDFLITSGLLVACLVLKLNVFPGISARLPRNFLIAVLCGLALLNLYAYHSAVAAMPVRTPDQTGFSELRRALVAERRAGFIYDEVRGTASEARLFQTQYALAPIVIVDGTSPDFVIGNFYKFDPALVPDDLVLVQVFGPELMLFRKRVP